MLTLLSLCVISTLLLPYCRGSTTPSYDEVTTDYTDYTFDYSVTEFTTMDYDGFELLNEDNNKKVESVNNEASTVKHGFYAIPLAVMVQQFCQQT